MEILQGPLSEWYARSPVWASVAFFIVCGGISFLAWIGLMVYPAKKLVSAATVLPAPAQQQSVMHSPGSTTLQAGRDIVIQQTAKRDVRPELADELALMRHSAIKRYHTWWNACQDPKASAAAQAEAEQVRQNIYNVLAKELSVADAMYFNTPGMNEPFPPNRTLSLCPDGVLINEFGHRLERLGKLVERIKKT